MHTTNNSCFPSYIGKANRVNADPTKSVEPGPSDVLYTTKRDTFKIK